MLTVLEHVTIPPLSPSFKRAYTSGGAFPSLKKHVLSAVEGRVRRDFERASFNSTCMWDGSDHKRAASGTPPACTSKTARPPEKFESLCSRARRPSFQPCGHRRFRSD